ncbi:MAG: hypothetical protein GX285_05950 [Clostridiales bacterium]|nr:hypothetical protein [Clostridiales bacterium]
MALDFQEYIASLGKEKYRSSIVIAEPGRGKTFFAKKAAKALGGKYLDLLEYFLNNKELVKTIDSFGPENFFQLLERETKGEHFVVVDHMDFLLDTWRDQEFERFMRGIRQQWNSFLERYRSTVCYFLQPSSRLKNIEITDSQGNSRIHKLSSFKAFI